MPFWKSILGAIDRDTGKILGLEQIDLLGVEVR
ncbi:hypothetical protein GGQ73_004296 [Rhizobium skierniewicense]|uniref:Uncharacterized protein n=1 Tax=Rhizobium skierniewicense TaxID=984260 RepID=A0A7W6CGL7_9HYPH|nr:hypothetical protein [Rhizobium skierniewicense]